jgi:hypothetical protein
VTTAASVTKKKTLNSSTTTKLRACQPNTMSMKMTMKTPKVKKSMSTARGDDSPPSKRTRKRPTITLLKQMAVKWEKNYI